MEFLPAAARLSRTDVEAFVPLTLLTEEATAAARRARELEERVGVVVDAEGGPDAPCDTGYIAIRASAYMSWKAAEQAAHVSQAVAGVLACASLARVVIAVQRSEPALERATRSLRVPLARAWHEGAASGPRPPRRDADDAEDERGSDKDERECAEEGCGTEALGWGEDEGPRAQRDSMWRMFLDGCDWWSARTALCKARTRCRVARALAKALVELRALYRPMEDVAVASWDARCLLHSRLHVRRPLEQNAAADLAEAVGGVCGVVRRLLRELQRMHAAAQRALQCLACTDERFDAGDAPTFS